MSDEIPLVWRKAGEPDYVVGSEHSEQYKHDTDLFYGAKSNEFLLGWVRRDFRKGFGIHLCWRLQEDPDLQTLGYTRTLAEAKDWLQGYVHAWWLTTEADYWRTQFPKDLQRYENKQRNMHEVSRQYRAARQT